MAAQTTQHIKADKIIKLLKKACPSQRLVLRSDKTHQILDLTTLIETYSKLGLTHAIAFDTS